MLDLCLGEACPLISSVGSQNSDIIQHSSARLLTIVYGEWADGEVYHYYPPMEQVREWIGKTGFDMMEEGEGDGYHHFIVCVKG